MDRADDCDEVLMAWVARGQAEALEKLIRRHASGLLTFLYRLVGDRHRSEELFQEVFLAVWTQRHRYEFPRSFRAWLYAIALNRCRSFLRLRSVPLQPLSDPEPAPSPGASPADSAAAAETAALVNDAVTRLPAQQRAVVVLRIWEGLSYDRIAEIVRCSEATARSHMHHGLTALRRHLEPRLQPSGRP